MDHSKGGPPPPPGGGRKKKPGRARKFLLVLLSVPALLLVLYLFRGPLFSGPLRSLLGDMLTRALHLPITVGELSGNWITSLEIGDLRSGRPGEGRVFRKLELDRLQVSLAPWDLLLGRPTWIRKVTLRGLVLALDLDQEKGKPGSPGRPKPLPPFVWKLRPELDISVKLFDLHLEGRSFHLEDGRFRLSPEGVCRLEGRSFAFPAPPGERGPLELSFLKRGAILERIRGRAARVRLEGCRIDFSRFPGILSFQGRLRHPFGRLSFQGRIDGKEMAFRTEGEKLRYQAAALFLPAQVPPLFDQVSTLSARGRIDLDRPLQSELTWALSLEGRKGLPLEEGKLKGKASGGRLVLSRAFLSGPSLQVQARGDLSLSGAWSWGISAKFGGELRSLGEAAGIEDLRCRGSLDLHLSGVGLDPEEGELSLLLNRLEARGIPELRDGKARAVLRGGRLVRLEEFRIRGGGGRLEVTGRARLPLSSPSWEGKAWASGIRLETLLEGGPPGPLDFQFFARGGKSLASLEGVFRLKPPRGSPLPAVEGEGAWDLSWRKGLALVCRRFTGLLEGEPFRWKSRGAVVLDGKSLFFPPTRLEWEGLDAAFQGSFPPREGKEAFSLAAGIQPAGITWKPLVTILSPLKEVGFSLEPDSPPLQVEAGLSSSRWEILFRGGRAGAPTFHARLDPAGRERTLLELRAENLRQAEEVSLEGILPIPLEIPSTGNLRGLVGKGRFRLLGWVRGLKGEGLPGLPFRGKAQVLLSLEGSGGRPDFAFRIQGRNLDLRPGPDGRAFPPVQGLETLLDLAWVGDECLFQGKFRGRGIPVTRIRGKARLPKESLERPEILKTALLEEELSLRADFEGNLPAFPPSPDIPCLEGPFQGSFRLKGSLLRPDCTISLKGENLVLRAGGGADSLQERIRRLSLRAHLSRNSLEGALQANFKKTEFLEAAFRSTVHPGAFFLEGKSPFGPDDALRGEARARGFRLARLSRFLPFPGELNGKITLQGRLSGTWAAPRPEGTVDLREGLVKFPSSLPALSGIRGSFQVLPDKVVVRELKASSAGGEWRVSGEVERFLGRPRLDLRLLGRDALLSRSPNLRCRGDLDLRVKGPLSGLDLTGKVSLTSCRYRARVAMLSEGILAAARAAQDFPSVFRRRGIRVESAQGPLFSLEDPVGGSIRFDVRIETKEPFLVKTNLFESSLLADLRLQGTGRSPLLEGQVTGLEGGRIHLPGMSLTIRALRLSFDPADPYRPKLQLMCEGRRHSVDVRVSAQGPLDDLKVDLSSSPPHTRKDLAALLATGYLPSGRGGGRAALGTLGTYLGEEVLGYISGGGEESWIAKRLTLEIGTEIGPDGTENIVADFLLSPGIYLQGERDVLGYYNLGLLFRWSLR